MPNDRLDTYYKQLVENFKPQEISYEDITTEQKTESDFASAISAYLEPYKQKSLKNIESSERAQRAMMDADAASRGMGSSTYLTDVKRQVSRQAQADKAGLESEFVSQIGQRTAEAWQNQLNRALNVAQTNAANRMTRDQWNAQERTRSETEAWQRAFELDSYTPNTVYVTIGDGGGGGGDTFDKTDFATLQAEISALAATSSYQPSIGYSYTPVQPTVKRRTLPNTKPLLQ